MDVLVVDDSLDVLRVHKRVLERAGFTVTCVDNGLDAFTEIEAHTFGAIVCDVQMPCLGGKSLFEQLEERYPSAAGRVVFVSGLVSETDTRVFLEQTGRPFLAKPAEMAEFVGVVRRVFDKTRFDRGLL